MSHPALATPTSVSADAIAAAAIAWAVAKAEHWALVQATYRDTGMPSKRDYAAVMAAERRMDAHRARLYDLALAASGWDGRAVGGQMELPLEGQSA